MTGSGTALVIIDMLNDLSFVGGEALLPAAKKITPRILALKKVAARLGLPVIYVNDNYGQWHADQAAIVAHVTRDGAPGAAIARALQPTPDDYFVIKPRISGFYATNLQVLLPELGVTALVLTGMAADICVLFTAADAHMRQYRLWVPSDCIAGEDDRRTAWATAIMQEAMEAETRPSTAIDIPSFVRSSSSSQ